MSLVSHELNSARKTTILWSLALSSLAVGFLLMYPVFTKDLATANQVFENIPSALKSALNISTDMFSSVTGFFSYLMQFILLAGSVMALVIGLKSLSQEETNKTADFLLTKPITRSQIVSAKLKVSIFSLLLTNIFFSLVAFITANLVSENQFSSNTFLLLCGSLLLVQLLFFSLGLVLSASLGKIKSVVSLAMPIAFSFFIISALDSAIGNINLAALTPFKFFSSTYIVQNSTYETKYLVLSIGLFLGFIWLAYYFYNHRDINSA